MTRVRILHVLESVSPRYGGPVAVLRALAKAQVARGDSVSLATTNIDFPRGILPVPTNRADRTNGVVVTHFTVQFRPLTVSLPLARALPALIDAHDIIHVHGLYRFPPSIAACMARRRRKPLVITPHGALDPFLHERSSRNIVLKRLYEWRIDLPNLNGATALHFTSAEEQARTAYLELRAPSFVLPNGLDWGPYETLPPAGSFRARLGIDPAARLVLFLGRINFKKGLDLLVPAFARVRQGFPDAVLAIVGPDNEGFGATVRALVDAHDLRPHVRFAEMLTGAAVRQAYVDADVFVLPSYSENFGIAVIEALACGTPVVITDQVNIHRDVAAAGAGRISPCDAGEIAAAIAALLHERDGARRMGAAGRHWVRTTYAWPLIVDQLAREYHDAIDRTQRAA